MSSSNDTINTVVVYHSGYGHTKRMAEAVADGAGAVFFAIDADGVLPEAGWSALDAADAIIFGAPTYMGGPSWQFKTFADQYFLLLAGQHGGLWVSLAIKPANFKASKRDDLNRMGSYIAPMAQSDADASPEEMSSGDLETGRTYGARVAGIVRRLAEAARA